jgi:MoxR-like ATPase
MATHPENESAAPMTRQFVRYGSSPRGAQALILGAKLRAILDHRYHVSREDIQAVAPMTLRHRLILNFEGQAEGVQADQVIENVLETIREPVAV